MQAPDYAGIETCTWGVLPEDLTTGDIIECVTRELEWVRCLVERP